MAASKDYNINFFFPNSDFAKDNNRLIAIIVIIWALSVFGFHFWMKAIEKEVAEPSLVSYRTAITSLDSGNATIEQKQETAQAYLMLMGKYLQLRSNDVLKKAFTLAAYELLPEDQKAGFADAVKAEGVTRTDFAYVAAAVGLADGEFDALLANVIPYAVTALDKTPTNYSDITPLMEKYFIHYRSFLTDTIFLGFPFHYFYTAVWLLVLFCGLCWIYCKIADTMMVKHNMETEEV
jgi:uncharacterized membrane protein